MLRATCLAITIAALASCTREANTAFAKGEVAGNLTSEGGKLGDWVFNTGTCYSGQREQYFGVIGYGPEKDGTAVKLIKDPVGGWTAVVNIASTCATQPERSNCRGLPLKQDDCDLFEANVQRTNTTVNDIVKLNGTLHIDCKIGDGTLKGKISFSGCH